MLITILNILWFILGGFITGISWWIIGATLLGRSERVKTLRRAAG